jgi:hypothetical protein
MFSLENGPNIETVSNSSEFFGNTPNISDNDHAMVCFPWFHHGINELLWVFIEYQIMFYVNSFPPETFQILEYDLGSTDQAAKDSSLHVKGVVRSEMLSNFFMGRSPVHFGL